MSSAVGRRYGRAIIDLADEQGRREDVARELKDVLAAWKESRELRDVFQNPAFGAESRKGILEALAARIGVSPMVKHALLLLSDRRRLRHLPEVIDAYLELAEERAGRVRAEVTTAGSMPESYFEELRKTLCHVTGKDVVLVRREDPSLIAGVVTRVGDRIFDGSLKNQLKELEDELLGRN